MAEFNAERPESDAADIRSSLAAAFTAQETAPTEPTEKVAPEAPASAESEGRQRAPDGKFLPREGAKDVAEPVEAEPKVPTTAEKPEDKAADPTGVMKAPENWAPADKATFKALPQQAQDFLLRRHTAMEADYTKKTQEIAAFRREYEPIHNLLAPHAQSIRDKGFTPASLINAWYQVEQSLLDPNRSVETVRSIINGYKIAPEKIAAALGLRVIAPDGTPPPPEPDGKAPIQIPPEILDRLTRHDQFIAQQQQEREAAARREYDTAAQRVMGEIETFATATDSAGALQHPHFQAVEDDMHRLVLACRASGQQVPPLSELYDQAVWANPSIRKQMLDADRAAEVAQRAVAEQKQKDEARARAERARRAGASVNGSPGGASQVTSRRNSTGSVRDDIAAAMEDAE